MAKYLDYGNIEDQLKLRRTCKPFSWFMKEVASSVYTAYPKPSPNLEWGSIQLENDNHIYWRPKCRDPPCTIQSVLSQSDPVFRLSKDGRLGLGERCLVLEVLENGKPGLQIGFCEKGQEEKWSYDPELKSMMLTMKPEKEEEEEDQNESENKDLKACVEYSGLNQNLEIKKCDGNPNQRWVWKRRI
ncbi:N-acetylgalactosaminyltransferase 7 [Eurytemora carolleeae]|uniref:N-acetylgalactosaminyltransferase 7 n=1 Tax=Eurytemora carolleeae TaxID=1294199 RepID=UPI000C7563F5|nr:N-acetylgalactosaminyltransferase 7 [Eurytemora carolleeae]|eukprot:XP_023319678.1 N-acetylgalactosaminyltransferase 7-like [Eurytemora affinis]